MEYRKSEIHFFNSFEKQQEFERKQMASLTPDKLLANLEYMRKFFLRQYLLPDGTWPSLSKIITLQQPHTQ